MRNPPWETSLEIWCENSRILTKWFTHLTPLWEYLVNRVANPFELLLVQSDS